MTSYAYLMAAVGFNVAAYMVFKHIAAWPQQWLWFLLFACGLQLGGVNTLLFNFALRGMNLSVAYPMFSSASIALVMLLSSMLFGEAIGSTRALGALVVALGIFMLTR